MFFNPQKIRPPHVSAILLILAVILHWTLKPGRIIPDQLIWIGIVVLASGVALMTKAHNLFKRKDTPVSHAETPQGVVTDGIYRATRNPMYVAGALIFLGIAIAVGTWPFFVSWLLIGAALNFIFIPWEEKRMEELFGDEYLIYKNGTRRWV